MSYFLSSVLFVVSGFLQMENIWQRLVIRQSRSMIRGLVPERGLVPVAHFSR